MLSLNVSCQTWTSSTPESESVTSKLQNCNTWISEHSARQLNQDVVENPYYGEAMDNYSQNNEKESYEYSPCDVSAVTKIENVYYEA